MLCDFVIMILGGDVRKVKFENGDEEILMMCRLSTRDPNPSRPSAFSSQSNSSTPMVDNFCQFELSSVENQQFLCYVIQPGMFHQVGRGRNWDSAWHAGPSSALHT